MIAKELSEKLRKVKLFVMDVDGTLTDCGMYYSEKGEEFKRFSTRDGMGITLLGRACIETAILTSEFSEIAYRRAEKLKIDHILTGVHDKKTALEKLAEKLSLDLDEISYIGDDMNDEAVIKIAGVTACPADAVDLIKASVDYICSNKGGNGAVREFAELVLKSQDKSIKLPEIW
jgi:3-deoxy-D-manno-octulosonate 8-phosphate phosphatase (KDO 8-P phosphatase)